MLGIVWTIIWFVFASNSPENNKFISEGEKEYILEETKQTRSSFEESESGAPWLSIMTSWPCIAVFFGHSCSNWGTYLFLTSLPLYMKEVLKFDIKSVCFLHFFNSSFTSIILPFLLILRMELFQPYRI